MKQLAIFSSLSMVLLVCTSNAYAAVYDCHGTADKSYKVVLDFDKKTLSTYGYTYKLRPPTSADVPNTQYICDPYKNDDGRMVYISLFLQKDSPRHYIINENDADTHYSVVAAEIECEERQ